MSKLMNTIKHPMFMLGAFLLLFVVAAVLIAYGVLTHEEPGLMDEDKRWAQMPLGVSCDGYAGPPDGDCNLVEGVVEDINRRLGYDALIFAGEGYTPEAEIVVTLGVPAEPGWMDPGGDATLAYSGNTYTRCDIRTSNTGTTEMLVLVLHHELGHCLGLAHDDFEQSIMRPVQTPTPDRTIPPWITDADRSLLRSIYVAPSSGDGSATH